MALASHCRLRRWKRCIPLLLITVSIQILIFYGKLRHYSLPISSIPNSTTFVSIDVDNSLDRRAYQPLIFMESDGEIVDNRPSLSTIRREDRPIELFFQEKWNFTIPDTRLHKLSKIYKHQQFLILLRRLGLISVWSINKEIKGYKECNPWWMNPFSIQSLESTKEINGSTFYQLIFEAQPGRIPFQTLIQITKHPQNNAHPYLSQDIQFIQGFRIDSLPTNCGNLTDYRIRAMCSCWSDNEKEIAEIRTKEIRKKWNKVDPEHKAWPVNISTIVSDYLTLGPEDYYKKPKKPAWLQNQGGYCGDDVKLLILIACTPSSFDRRQAVRTTFGNPDFLRNHSSRVVFVLGKSLNLALQKKIEEEEKKYGDILQGNFVENYQNMTLQLLTTFSWVVNECKIQNAAMPRWILKADDDYFLNIPLALKIASQNPNANLIGHMHCNAARLSMQSKDKHHTPAYMHIPNFYPNFLTGTTFLIQSKILVPLLQASIYTPFMNMDDVYVTGVLTSEIGIMPFDSFFIYRNEAEPTNSICWPKVFVSVWIRNAKQMKIYWDNFNNKDKTYCNKFIRKSLLISSSNCIQLRRFA